MKTNKNTPKPVNRRAGISLSRFHPERIAAEKAKADAETAARPAPARPGNYAIEGVGPVFHPDDKRSVQGLPFGRFRTSVYPPHPRTLPRNAAAERLTRGSIVAQLQPDMDNNLGTLRLKTEMAGLYADDIPPALREVLGRHLWRENRAFDYQGADPFAPMDDAEVLEFVGPEINRFRSAFKRVAFISADDVERERAAQEAERAEAIAASEARTGRRERVAAASQSHTFDTF